MWPTFAKLHDSQGFSIFLFSRLLFKATIGGGIHGDIAVGWTSHSQMENALSQVKHFTFNYKLPSTVETYNCQGTKCRDAKSQAFLAFFRFFFFFRV